MIRLKESIILIFLLTYLAPLGNRAELGRRTKAENDTELPEENMEGEVTYAHLQDICSTGMNIDLITCLAFDRNGKGSQLGHGGCLEKRVAKLNSDAFPMDPPDGGECDIVLVIGVRVIRIFSRTRDKQDSPDQKMIHLTISHEPVVYKGDMFDDDQWYMYSNQWLTDDYDIEAGKVGHFQKGFKALKIGNYNIVDNSPENSNFVFMTTPEEFVRNGVHMYPEGFFNSANFWYSEPRLTFNLFGYYKKQRNFKRLNKELWAKNTTVHLQEKPIILTMNVYYHGNDSRNPPAKFHLHYAVSTLPFWLGNHTHPTGKISLFSPAARHSGQSSSSLVVIIIAVVVSAAVLLVVLVAFVLIRRRRKRGQISSKDQYRYPGTSIITEASNLALPFAVYKPAAAKNKAPTVKTKATGVSKGTNKSPVASKDTKRSPTASKLVQPSKAPAPSALARPLAVNKPGAAKEKAPTVKTKATGVSKGTNKSPTAVKGKKQSPTASKLVLPPKVTVPSTLAPLMAAAAKKKAPTVKTKATGVPKSPNKSPAASKDTKRSPTASKFLPPKVKQTSPARPKL